LDPALWEIAGLLTTGLGVRNRTADLGSRLVLAQTDVNHLTEQVLIRPGQIFDLGHQLGPDPMHAAEHERRAKPACPRQRHVVISRLDPDHWRVEYAGGGSGMFREADIRAYVTSAERPRRAKATAPQKAMRSRYAIDREAIAAGRLPPRAPIVTSAANSHYQKHFDRLFGLAKAGDWDGVRNYEVKGSNSYSKMVARYRQDLLAVHAALEAAP
jgi:hypothetical protein